ncbi:N-acetylglucosamine-6-phosphate deacetylase [Pinisolibacter sp.]|mgnify:CR=1 FL=1|uniref:N-acetylglucosamine-6-phosphate deacetylase n=1 Tax=Pinisolibacter sp. TaxID=2172024 RepID=UPI002FDDD366
MIVSEGLFDLQVNGFAGIDFNSGALTPDDLDLALEAMLATGVTHCLPTVITAQPDELAARFAALDAAVSKSRLGPLMCPGYHLEGPFLNPAPGYCGCHPPSAMGPADPSLIVRLEASLARPILLVTVAPEIDGGLDLIAGLSRRGKIVALGYTACDFDTARAAADAGAVLATHLGNGLPQTLHKLANPIFAQLAEDRLWASFIADGIHIDPRALKGLIRARGIGRSILVTDAVAAAAAPVGPHEFAGMPIERRADGSARRASSEALAGSALCLDRAVRNLVAWGIATAQDAIAMASAHPRALLAPALAAHGVAMGAGRVAWSDVLDIVEASADA